MNDHISTQGTDNSVTPGTRWELDFFPATGLISTSHFIDGVFVGGTCEALFDQMELTELERADVARVFGVYVRHALLISMPKHKDLRTTLDNLVLRLVKKEEVPETISLAVRSIEKLGDELPKIDEEFIERSVKELEGLSGKIHRPGVIHIC